jgi:hypothetical protein
MLFGAQPGPNAGPAGTVVIFGYACLLITAIGILRVLWRWRTARRAEQVLLAAMAANMGVYILSTLPAPNSPHDIVAVLPCGAVLAARALVPERIVGRLTSLVATGFAMVAALLPLSMTATQASAAPVGSPLAVWLQAHGLTYGLAGYWDGSAVTLQTGDQAQIRAVHMSRGVTGLLQVSFYAWETNSLWFDPTRHYANFAVINLVHTDDIGAAAARIFGKPVSTHIIGSWEVLIYDKNLLTDVLPAQLPPTS